MQHAIRILTLLLPLVGAASISKRAADRGTYELKCKDGEGACNNAAFYINCIANKDNKITYLGVNKPQNNQNRIESGCRAGIRQDSQSGPQTQTGSSSSVCQQFPYGMKFIPDPDRLDQPKAKDYECDEWPPASAQQFAYGSKPFQNSLRCITSAENLKLGTQLSQIYQGHTPNQAGTAAKMDAGDFFKVTFDTTNADMNKLKYLKTPIDCTNDGFQFQLTDRPNLGGLISGSSPTARDSQYTLKGSPKPVGMCSIDFTRETDDEFTKICVTDDTNKDCATGLKATIKGKGSHAVKGLPKDVTITTTGALGSPIKFEYDGVKWDTDSRGTGKGPGGSRGESTHLWCRTLDGKSTKPAKGAAPKSKEYTCYFPC